MFRFTVPECARAVISAAGLVVGDELVLWRLACEGDCGDESSYVFIEFAPNGCHTVIDTLHNPLLVDVPGTYELRFAGAVNPDVRICQQVYARNCAGA